MNMAKAIALSPGNKAKTYDDDNNPVIVQERYTSVSQTWLHAWHIKGDAVMETDLPLNRKPIQLKAAYGVDPDGKEWIVIG